jgi:hypothetical protein
LDPVAFRERKHGEFGALEGEHPIAHDQMIQDRDLDEGEGGSDPVRDLEVGVRRLCVSGRVVVIEHHTGGVMMELGDGACGRVAAVHATATILQPEDIPAVAARDEAARNLLISLSWVQITCYLPDLNGE